MASLLTLLYLLRAANAVFCDYEHPGQQYDYVIVGGGTAGLVLANRLSEGPSVAVAVIEAGDSVYNNTVVQDTTSFTSWVANLGSSIDYAYSSQPQSYADNRTLSYDAGKALGGTSTINGMTYVRAEAAQIDAFETVGNKGWNWNSLFPYYLKSEHFKPPTPELAARGASYEPPYHGYTGALDVGWQKTLLDQNASAIVNATWQALGMPYRKDIQNGDLRGFNVWPFTLDADTSIREDAARAYYYPIAGRPNLSVFLNTTARRIVWTDGVHGHDTALMASGVEVSTSNSTITVISARREVILSAGTLRSPLLLEHSGVGNPAILGKYGLPVRLALPSVGENLQDQPNNVLAGGTATNWTGFSPYVSYLTATDLWGADTSAVEAHVRSSIAAYATTIAGLSNNSTTAGIQEKLLTLQTNLIFKQNVALGEILTVFDPTFIGTALWGLLPFSRGSVHIQSSNVSVGPAIQPNFFNLDFDIMQHTAVARRGRLALQTPPLSDYITSLISPNTTVLPLDATDEQWANYLKASFSSNNHPVGTTAMMARELGGVVDERLKVYGTRNVRVCDAGVLPFMVDGHLTATIYAVAERAADIIKGII